MSLGDNLKYVSSQPRIYKTINSTISAAFSVNPLGLSLLCQLRAVHGIWNSSGTNDVDVPRILLSINIQLWVYWLLMYTCYFAAATFDNNKSDDSDTTTTRRESGCRIDIAAARGPHCCRVILRPPHDRRLALQISHDRYSITKESKKKNLIHFPVLRLFVDSAARLVIS